MPQNVFAKSKNSNNHYKISGVENISELFPDIDLTNAQPFTATYNPNEEEQEILYIELTEEDVAIVRPYMEAISSSGDINIIPLNAYKNIHVVYTGREENNNITIKFQRIWNKYYFRKGWYSLWVNNEPTIHNNTSLITLTGNTDAYWDGATNRLYFKSFRIAKTIFPELEKFYREATSQEVHTFSSHPLISVPENLKFKPRALRKIALMIDTHSLDNKNISDLQAYAQEYNQSFPEVENNKIKISSGQDIELLYKLTNELFYTTSNNQKRATNSFRPI